MTTVSILLVLLSAMLHVTWNYLTKSSSNPKLFSMYGGLTTVFITIVFAFWVPLHLIPSSIWIAILVSGVIHSLYVFALSSAYETGDISYVYPIARSAPAFVPIAAFLLFGELFTPLGILGIVLVVFCIFLLQFRRRNLKQKLSGLLKFIRQKDSFWAFVTLGTVVAYTLIDKVAMVDFHQVEDFSFVLQSVTYFLFASTVSYIIYTITLLIQKVPMNAQLIKTEWPQILAKVFGSLVSYSLILYVMQTEPVGYIVTLRQSSVLFAVIAGWLFLKEQQGVFRLITALLMFIGLFLVATAG